MSEGGTCVWEDEPTGDGSVANDRNGSRETTQRIKQSGLQYGPLRLFDEVKQNKSGKSGQKRRSWKKGDLL